MEKKSSIIKNNADSRRSDSYPVRPAQHSKKREPSNAPPRSESNRKQNASRGKPFERRPRPREVYRGCSVGGKENSGLGDGPAEVGSVFSPGCKKRNLNDMIEYRFASQEMSRQPNRGGRKQHRLVHTNTHKHNRELFLQSNCQFVVKADGDYSPYMVDPDIPVSWSFIEQINVRINEPLSCPICLGETVAGRITKCGHAYCWPCLLRYFSMEEGTSRPCPVCSQPIDKASLKSVQGIWHSYVPVGQEITMKLMRRSRGGTFVELAPSLEDMAEGVGNLPFSVSNRGPSTLYSKLLTATPREVIQIISRERHELNSQFTEDLEYPEFVLEALHLLQLREDLLPLAEAGVQVEDEPADKVADDSSELSTSDDLNEVGAQPRSSDDSGLFEKSNVDDGYIYFYQAADGQTVFLHGLYNRILEASWGSLRFAPRELRGIILERASGSVDQESRRRLRCLQHLPVHCPYDFIDIDLKPPFVTKDALKDFKIQLDDRKRDRQKRAREEKRREKIISEKERVIMGHVPTLEININSEEHFPAYQPDLDLTSPPCDGKWERESLDSSTDSFSGPGPSSLNKKDNSISFAKMASAKGTWKIRQTPKIPVPSSKNNEEDDENEIGSPLECNLGDVISAALQKTSLTEPSNKEGKKKKKQKPKVLFATGIHHA